MKTRIGFVSNSSSSSFVLLGYKVNPDKYSKEYMHNSTGFDCLSGEEDGVGDNTIVGKFIADIDNNEGCEFYVLDLNEIVKEVEKLKEKFPNDEQIKIYTGTRMC